MATQFGRTDSTIFFYKPRCDNKDARDWARDFMAKAAKNPNMTGELETMTVWFASCICAGYEEAIRRMAPHLFEDGNQRPKPAPLPDELAQ